MLAEREYGCQAGLRCTVLQPIGRIEIMSLSVRMRRLLDGDQVVPPKDVHGTSGRLGRGGAVESYAISGRTR